MASLSNPPIREPVVSTGNNITRVWAAWFQNLSNFGNTGTTAARGVITVSGGETYNMTDTTNAINLEADTGVASVTLPQATSENVGQSVVVTLRTATFNGLINAKSGDDILGFSSVTLSVQWTSIELMVQSAGKWVFI
jgi:hypothetical protein